MSSESQPESTDEPTPKSPLAADVSELEVADEMEQSYIDYAMSVIAGRALPDARDGLKPVQRRILYAMAENGISSGGGHRKSSSIVGETMGNYHPHGDSAIYEALVRMAQQFSMRAPLVDGQGNFGSIDGDPAAAMRYTEARLTPLSETLLEDLEDETVDWQSSYDDRNQEPTVLPSRFPNLLVNGSSGIAVGMSTNVPPHNLGEIIDATTHLIDTPDATVGDLAEFVEGPDFPTGGIIVGHDPIRQAYETGRGRLRVRAKLSVDRADSGRDRIVITELPYQQNKSKLIEKIADDVNDGDLDEIADLTDESDRNGVRIVLEVKTRANTDLAKNKLLDSHLENTFGVINLALVDGQPQVLSLKGMLQEYIDHRKDVVRRRTQHELDEAEEEAHILDGRITALDHVDDVVETIREADDRDGANDALRDAFEFSERQADHIVRMQLGSLTALEVADVEDDYDAVQSRIDRLREILGAESELLGVIKDELQDVREAHAEERRTEVIEDEETLATTDLISDDDMVVTLSKKGYLKRMDATEFGSQSRNGKGVIGMDIDEEDSVQQLVSTSMHESIYCVTEDGTIYEQPVHELEAYGRQARGGSVKSAFGLDADSTPATLLTHEEIGDNESLVFLSANGLVKRTEATEYDNVRASGLIATKVREDDRIVDAMFVDDDVDLMVESSEGQAIRFDFDDVRPTGRSAFGVVGISLEDGDSAVGFTAVASKSDGEEDVVDEANREDGEAVAEEGQQSLVASGETSTDTELPTQVFTITENGYGKRSEIGDYTQQSRGGKGLIDIDSGSRNGSSTQILGVDDGTELVFVTAKGQILRTPNDGISSVSRASKGIAVVNVEPNDSVVDVVALAAETDE